MADFFTLNPRYERYELGVYPLEYQTVYGDEKSRFGGTTLRAIFLILLIALSLKILGTESMEQVFTPAIIDQIMLVIIIAAVLLVAGKEIATLSYTSQTNKRYQHLTQNGVLLSGRIKNIRVKEQRFYYRDKSFQMREYRGTYYIVVTYLFTTPDQRMISGEQTREREDLRDKPLPPDGTPIRVLYADDNTHVML